MKFDVGVCRSKANHDDSFVFVCFKWKLKLGLVVNHLWDLEMFVYAVFGCFCVCVCV